MSKEKKTSRIKVGETVTMGKESGRRGHKGRVLCFWPSHEFPATHFQRRIEDGKQIFDCNFSVFDRYLVEVPRVGKRCPLSPAYYAPLAGKLEKENPGARRTRS